MIFDNILNWPGGQQQYQPGGVQHDHGEGYEWPITFKPVELEIEMELEMRIEIEIKGKVLGCTYS